MKKVLCVFLAVLMAVSVLGCSQKDTENTPRGGKNSQGENTTQAPEQSENPLQVRNLVSTVATSNGQYMVVKEDGSLWGWGNNESCQIAFVTQTVRNKEKLLKQIYEPQHIMDQVVSVGVGSSYCLALKEDGTLWVWGDSFTEGCEDIYAMSDLDRQKAYCTPKQILDDVISFSAGHRHFLAIRSDGTLWAAGFNMTGQTDWAADNNDFVSVPKQVMTNCVAVAAGADQSYCIKEDGTLWSWGDGYHGVLGRSTSEYRGFNEPMLVMEDAVCVAAGSREGYAVKSDNTLWSWGCGASYHDGKCNCFDSPDRYLPTKLMDDVYTVTASMLGSHMLAQKTDGTLWGHGVVSMQSSVSMEVSNHFGYDAQGMKPFQNDTQAAYNNSENFVHGMIELPISNIAFATVGAHGSLFVTQDGQLIGCGYDAVRAYEHNSDVVYYDEEGFYGPLMTDVRLN